MPCAWRALKEVAMRATICEALWMDDSPWGNRWNAGKTPFKFVKHKNNGTIAINIQHQVEVKNHHVETMGQLWCTKNVKEPVGCSTQWIISYVDWSWRQVAQVVQSQIACQLSLWKTRFACPLSSKDSKKRNSHEELHRLVALAQNEGNTYPADKSDNS